MAKLALEKKRRVTKKTPETKTSETNEATDGEVGTWTDENDNEVDARVSGASFPSPAWPFESAPIIQRRSAFSSKSKTPVSSWSSSSSESSPAPGDDDCETSLDVWHASHSDVAAILRKVHTGHAHWRQFWR